jgi:uncharacterized protein (DUF2062 family)
VLRFQASIVNLSPEQAALLLSVGVVLGVFPVVGCPTVLCLLAALGLRLNFAALQLINNVSSPLQLVLILPLERIGAWLCGGALAADGFPAGKLGVAALHAIAGWGCISIPLGVLLYVAAIFAVRRGRPLWFNGVKSPA